MRLVANGAVPQRQAMLRRACEGQTVATEMANQLVASKGVPFRTAHRTIGEMLRAAEADRAGGPFGEASDLFDGFRKLDPYSVVQASRYGGGPAPESLATCLQNLNATCVTQRDHIRRISCKWRASRSMLDDAVESVLSSS
jgi:argininosuccinate lyase